MESKKSVMQGKTSPSEDNKNIYAKNPEEDSSISITFDSASDCSYKSGEIIANLTSTEQLSNLSLSDDSSKQLKSDQITGFDSGFIADSISPLSECGYCLKEESSKLLTSPTSKVNEKLQWHDIFTQDKDGDTFLHLAIVEARSDVIFPLIRLAPHPDFLDITNDLYQTPLHLATLTGKPHIVRRLVLAGATLDIQDHGGNIPLHIACRSGDLDCVQAILTPITDSELEEAHCLYQIYIQNNNLAYLINMKNFDGQSCVHLAAAGGWRKVLDCLFSHNADINEQDGKSGRTALHYAVESENYELVNLLLSEGNANPLVQNYAGQTSCCVARSLRKRNPNKIRQAIFDLLKKHAEKWDSASEFDSNSSSDESDYIDAMLQTFKEASQRK